MASEPIDGGQSKEGRAPVKATDVGAVMEAEVEMQEPGTALFDTPIGLCGIAWSALGLRGVQLPETVASAARARLAHRFPGSAERDPSAAILAIIETIRQHLSGCATAYDEAILDFAGVGAWEASVYRAALAIRYGETRTYGALFSAPGGAHTKLRLLEIEGALGPASLPLFAGTIA